MRRAVKRPASRRVAITRTFVNVILDESGSMMTCQDEAVSGYNAYIEDLKDQDGTFFVTLTKFNTINTVVEAATALRKVNPLVVGTSYIPGGFTALYDAIAKCVQAMDAKVRPTDRVLTVIITDGAENSSREWNKAQVENLIKTYEQRGNWSFVYLSAAPTAFADAAVIGVAAGNTYNYEPTRIGTVNAMRKLSTDTASYSNSSLSSTKSFFSPDDETKVTSSGRPLARRRTLK